MVVLPAPLTSLPIASIEHAAFVAWWDPEGSSVWRPSPVSIVPPIVAALGVPISVNPDVARPWSQGLHSLLHAVEGEDRFEFQCRSERSARGCRQGIEEEVVS